MQKYVQNLKKQKGLTAIELGVALVLSAIVIVGIIIALVPYSDSAKVSAYQTQINHIFSGADRWKASKPTYSGISCPVLLSLKHINGKSNNCSSLGVDGGSVTVQATNASRSVRVIIDTNDDTVAGQVADFYSNLGNEYSASVTGDIVTITR